MELLVWQDTPPDVSSTLSLMVATNHLNGALRMEMKYVITGDQNYSNRIDSVVITPWLPKQDRAASQVYLAPTDTIVDGMKEALAYFQYAIKHLQKERSHPLSFEVWSANRTH